MPDWRDKGYKGAVLGGIAGLSRKRRLFRKLGRGEAGASAVEYGILIALIATVLVVSVAFLGQTTSSSFSCRGVELATRGSSVCP
jgi:Flp pilus assembly pilin Flp